MSLTASGGRLGKTPQEPSPGTYPGKPARGLPLLVNLCVFLLCAWCAFTRNINGLFYHLDGACTFIEIRNQYLLGAPLSFTNDYYQSIGNIQFLQSARWLFFLWPISWFDDLQVARLSV